MAPVMYLAAGVTVLLCSLTIGTEAQTAVTSAATQICISSINKARAARLDVRESVVTAKVDAGPATAALAALTDKADNTTCTLPGTSIPTLAAISGFLASFTKASASLTDGDCDVVVQKVITDAITQIGTDSAKPFKLNTAPYTDANVAAQNFGYIMDKNATEISCAVTTNCVDNNSILVCLLFPAIDTTAGVVPFTADFYAAVKARAAANVTIQSMTDADIGKDLSSGGGGNSARTIMPAAAIIVSVLGLLNL